LIHVTKFILIAQTKPKEKHTDFNST